jgi:hypothetical protein
MSIVSLSSLGQSTDGPWSADQSLKDFMTFISDNEIIIDDLIVIFKAKGKRVGWRCDGKSDPYEKVGMAQGFIHDYVRTIDGYDD